MAKKKKVTYTQINKEQLNIACDAYFHWKELRACGKRLGSKRSPNIQDFISEPIACYCLNLLWNTGCPGDATDPVNNKRIEIKATSRTKGDLTSFGPKCRFDNSFCMMFNVDDDIVYIYDLNKSSEDIEKYAVNKKETVKDQKEQKRRPRLSLKKLIIDKEGLVPIVVFDLQRKKVVFDSRGSQLPSLRS